MSPPDPGARARPAGAVRIVRFRPTRPWVRPGSTAIIEIRLATEVAQRVRLVVELLDLDQVAGRAERDVRLQPGESNRTMALVIPDRPRRGYGLQLRLGSDDATPVVADAAVEALDGWWEAPRHAALTVFSDPAQTVAAVEALRDWHVTVIQAYDWMYRHYRYLPPRGEGGPNHTFTDTLGRTVSLAAVRAGIRAGHRAGIATLAYGSIYGAEREHVERHPDDRVFDAAGSALSLGETFFINDIRPGRPWRARLLREYTRAVREVGFDGIHMDTYGPPHRAVGADGGAIDFADLEPGLIADGAAAVAAARPGAHVLFNCVEGFPLEAVADAPAAALYLELWPPDERYADIVRWIDRARTLGRGRAVIIAAYLSCLRTNGEDRRARPGAVESVVLLTSVISAAGAFHHVLADEGRVLVEGYYPEAQPLHAPEVRELLAAWEFSARHVHALSDPGARVAAIAGLAVTDGDGADVPLSGEPIAGSAWVRATQLPDGTRVLNLVDLRTQPDDRWDALRAPTPEVSGWTLQWPGAASLVATSPWTDAGRSHPIEARPDGVVPLPTFRRWIMLVERQGGPSA